MNLKLTSPEAAEYRIQYRPNSKTGTVRWCIDRKKTSIFGRTYWKELDYEYSKSLAESRLIELTEMRKKEYETYYFEGS